MPRFVRSRVLVLLLTGLLGASAAPALAAGGHEAKGPVTDGPFYMRPPQILASKFADGGIIHVGVRVSIEIADKDNYDRAREVEPRLIDALVRELNVIAMGPWVTEKGVDEAVVKRRFMAATVRILGNSIPRDLKIDKSYARRAY
jgi:hypothetical protein